MSLSRLVAATALVTTIAIAAGAHADQMKWVDGLSLELEGKGWANTAGPFDRLPDSAKEKVPQTAWELSKNSAGMCLRFITDAPAVSAQWSVTSGELAMPHMPATGVSGIDLYERTPKGSWRFVGNGRPFKVKDNSTVFTFPEGGNAVHECLLYLPLYNGTESIRIGVPSGARLEKAAPRPANRRRPVVFYGTSITQGGCASRPGMACPAILGRMLDRPTINLGFSGSGTMEPPVGEALAELDPAAYVIDCLWNIGVAEQQDYDRRVGGLVESIRKAHPFTPIIFVGQSYIIAEAHPTEMTKRLETSVVALQKKGVRNLYMVPGTDLIGDDGEATVDGVHMTDLGMLRQSNCLLPILQKALRGHQ